MKQDSLQWLDFLNKYRSLPETSQVTLFDLALTDQEKQAIISRLSIFKALLKQERSQRELTKDLSVSIATITRCSNYLKNLSSQELDAIKSILLHQMNS